jgi:hypothetical protein
MAAKKQATTRGESKASIGLDTEPRFVPPPDDEIAASLTDDRAVLKSSLPSWEGRSEAHDQSVLKSSLPSPLAVEAVLEEQPPAGPVDVHSHRTAGPIVHVWRCMRHPSHRVSRPDRGGDPVQDRACPVCGAEMTYAVEPA